MTLLLPGAIAVGTFITSVALTGWLRRNAEVHLLIDVPNSRSSHTVATPRGGGVAIVVPSLIALIVLGRTGWLPWRSVSSLCGSGVLVALVGLADDRAHIAARWRLAGHFVAALSAIVAMGGVPPLSIMGIALDRGWLGWTVISLYIVWMLNLTNFMDGIDGIASVETITVCVGAAVVSAVASSGAHLWLASAVIASATLGFLVWNWPPAKIFMGDVGSGFLGVMLAVLALETGWAEPPLFWSWVILFGVFAVDATVTLIRRVARGERFYEAHRTHAYQHAAAARGTHKPVTMAVGAINLCWLLPIALMVAVKRLNEALGLAIAYTPLVVVAVRMGAGKPDVAPRPTA
jgi:Fuc2NAc and GlcNAc transferase